MAIIHGLDEWYAYQSSGIAILGRTRELVWMDLGFQLFLARFRLALAYRASAMAMILDNRIL
jgi:hypothetical protein